MVDRDLRGVDVPNLIHLVSMQQPAGVEAHFAEFIECAAARHPAWSQSWLNPARTMHPYFQERLEHSLAHRVDAKYRWGIKLPSRPAAVRAWHRRSMLTQVRPDAMVIWNRTAKVNAFVDAMGEARCIHWEHGSAWDAGREMDRERYLERIPRVIANSKASARFLQLGWGYAGQVSVCRNALRPSLAPRAPMQKAYPRDSPIRLGIAARLYPVKGVALVLQAVKLLRERSVDVELEVAGTGPELSSLQALAARLNIAHSVRFRGAVEDMHSLYMRIHCLVHAPLTEAFGLVALEAAVHGAPVVAAAVDGLPEAVTDGVTGYTVPPGLPLAEYRALGGNFEGLPERVYDPARDRLQAPRVADPSALADGVQKLFASAEVYEGMSRSASEHVLREYPFHEHVDEVMGVIADALPVARPDRCNRGG